MKTDHRAVLLQNHSNLKVKQTTLYEDQTCDIIYRDGTVRTIRVHCDLPYILQYGMPVSFDGDLLFTSSWEDGLVATRITDGTVAWRCPGTRMTRVFVYEQFLIAVRMGISIIKIDLFTGQVMEELKSTTIDRAFYLNEDYLLVQSIKGKVSVLSSRQLNVVKSYKKQAVNPRQCLSFVIRDAFLRDNRLVISGFEEYPNRSLENNGTDSFERIIDGA